MRVERYPENPLVTPKDVKPSVEGWEVLSSFNAGIAEYNGEILMLMRVAERPKSNGGDKVLVPILDFRHGTAEQVVLEFSAKDKGINLEDPRVVTFTGKIYLTSISHFRIARSKDGHNFTVDEQPAIRPDKEYEAYGIEDPRITKLGDTYWIVYKGVAPTGITQCLASTKDFVTFEKHGVIFAPENMDGILFPDKIRGKYAALHRPHPKFIGTPNMWIAYSEDLLHWGEHHFLLGCVEGSWESGRVGGGAVPFMTDKGWLEIYHAANPQDEYCLGALLLDKDYPEKVLAKSAKPILRPETDYETHGFMSNVVFTCGAIVKGDTVSIYYGSSDELMAGVDMSVSEILDSLEPVRQIDEEKPVL